MQSSKVPEHTFRIPPLRSIREFVGGNEWSKPTFVPSEFGELQKQVISNLIYYQSNYGAIAIPFLLLVAFFRPAALLFGLVVIAVLLAGFVYSSRQQTALTAIAHDRPIVVLVVLLVASFFVIRMFGTVFIFLLGIALPLALIVAHATARTPTLQNKAANTAEGLALEVTPMGLLLGWLGAKPPREGQQSKTTTKSK
jgi:hypothetical protein